MVEKTWYVTFVVPHTTEEKIKAETLEEAIEKAKAMNPEDLFWDLLEDVSGAEIDYIWCPETNEFWEGVSE